MVKQCHHCGTRYESRSARAKFCSSACRVKSHKERKRQAVVAELRPEPAAEPVPSVLASVRAELESAGVLASSAGASALAMAARIDAQAENGQAIASLVRQLHATMAVATASAAKAADPLDELLARRKARRLA